MQIHFNKMTDDQRLRWLQDYERQNPAKYLMKFGKVIGTVPPGKPFAGQPNNWEYVSPEEALKKISPSYAAQTALKVEISEKKNIEQEVGFNIPEELTPTPIVLKRGRKLKNV